MNCYLFLQGAPERIVAMCSSILVGADEFEMTDMWKRRVARVYAEFGSLGERVLGKKTRYHKL